MTLSVEISTAADGALALTLDLQTGVPAHGAMIAACFLNYTVLVGGQVTLDERHLTCPREQLTGPGWN
ncbi:MAG TPA: hypothetical protein VNV82_24990 [Bryobacteraceae bacterium]|nr:hypothetical protein [Bryobacteraceae bacterium]